MSKLTIAIAFALALATAPAPVQAVAPSSYCYGVHGRTVCNGHSVRRWTCAYISRDELSAIGMDEALQGGVFASTGLLASGTVVGLPLGTVLGLLGVATGTGGGFLMWYAGSPYFHPGWRCGYV
jgi:hypothetical protein